MASLYYSYSSSLILAIVCVLGTKARVIQDFKQCRGGEHFYNNMAPDFKGTTDRNFAKICQTMNGNEYFSSLYNTMYRIPVFSAYQANIHICPMKEYKSQTWFIEPQLAKINAGGNMKLISRATGITKSEIKYSQAHREDYENTGYDKGHLNPSGHHCQTEFKKPTFTLTNVVPQDPCFNRIYWSKMEEHVKTSLKRDCGFLGGNHYIITGSSNRITQYIPGIYDRNENTPSETLQRVGVPSHLWSAVCCDTSQAQYKEDRNKGWSFGFYGPNRPESSIKILTIAGLNTWLSKEYGTPIRLFQSYYWNGDCEIGDVESQNQYNSAQKVVDLQALRKLQYNPIISPSSSKAVKRFVESNVYVTGGKIAKLIVNTVIDILYLNIDKQSVSTSLIDQSLYCDQIPTESGVAVAVSSHYVNPDQAVCRVKMIEEHKDITTAGKKCREDHHCGYHMHVDEYRSSIYKWCYVGDSGDYGLCCDTHCAKNPDASSTGNEDAFTCQVGSKGKRSCVPGTHTDQILNGHRCREDHLCGTHGYNYYWCYYDYDDNWDYCCATWSVCAKHGNSAQSWCNTRYIWDYCSHGSQSYEHDELL